jgi:hypothetical protein
MELRIIWSKVGFSAYEVVHSLAFKGGHGISMHVDMMKWLCM